MKKLVLCAVVALLLSPLASAQSTSTDDTLRDELARIDASLKEIARALKQQAETQHADLLLKRVTLSVTQLAASEERLKRIDQETRALREEESEMQASLKMLQAKGAPLDTPATPHRDQIGEINIRLSAIQEHLTTLNGQRIETQNEIERLRRDAREWQASLDKFLSIRP